jgi:hypothetical protein
MERKRTGFAVNAVTSFAFLLMVTVNTLANIVKFNGVTTGQVSDDFPNLFAPAGITFAIWGVIYFLLAAYTAYQLGLFRPKGENARDSLFQKVGWIFSVSSLANAIWIFAWQYYSIALSMLLMAVILICLIWINLVIKKEQLTTREKFFIRLPFSVYFGWITIATIANATTLLASLDWNGFGLPQQFWAGLMLGIGMLIGTTVMMVNRDKAYGLVLIWAYIGILIKHVSATGFMGLYPAVMFISMAGAVLFVIMEGYLLFFKRQEDVDREKLEKGDEPGTV